MKQEKLIVLPAKGKIVFVGDTHGDLEASKKIIGNYLKSNYKIVFLGDYVDRGYDSKGNIDFLLEARKKHPKQVYLLLGNHDAFGIQECYPNDFWESLEEREKQNYFRIFENFPLAISAGGIVALHGALPAVEKLEDINKIEDRDKNWMKILRGDFAEVKGGILEERPWKRPLFGADYFNELMNRYNKKVLIRGHQSEAAEAMFDKKCLTIFTSSAYPRRRIVAIADLEKDIKSIDDLAVEEV
ncbi:MAG: metallophosphoesterase family protein [archaeon]